MNLGPILSEAGKQVKKFMASSQGRFLLRQALYTLNSPAGRREINNLVNNIKGTYTKVFFETKEARVIYEQISNSYSTNNPQNSVVMQGDNISVTNINITLVINKNDVKNLGEITEKLDRLTDKLARLNNQAPELSIKNLEEVKSNFSPMKIEAEQLITRKAQILRKIDE